MHFLMLPLKYRIDELLCETDSVGSVEWVICGVLNTIFTVFILWFLFFSCTFAEGFLKTRGKDSPNRNALMLL